jgi:hypothetical protein
MCYVRYVNYVVLAHWSFLNWKYHLLFPCGLLIFANLFHLIYSVLIFPTAFLLVYISILFLFCVPLYQNTPSGSCGFPVYMMILICLAWLSHPDLHFYNISCIASFAVSTLPRIRILNKVVTPNV